MSVPTQTTTAAVPFEGGPLNASILILPTPLEPTYVLGGPGHEAGGVYNLADDGQRYAWHVAEPPADVQLRPAQDEPTAQLRPEPLAAGAQARPRRNSRRVEPLAGKSGRTPSPK